MEGSDAAELVSLQTLGRLTNPDRNIFGEGVSRNGKVVAGWASGGGPTEATRWVDSTGTGLGFLKPPSDGTSRAFAASANGKVIVGSSGDPSSGGANERAFRWHDGKMRNLGNLQSGAQGSSIAYAVNATGDVVVGISSSPTMGNGQPFRWEGGTMNGLGCPPDYMFQGRAAGVNDDGTVVVGHCSNGIAARAFRWVTGSGRTRLPNLKGGSTAVASAVNADGSVIAGRALNGVTNRNEAVRWVNGIIERLGVLKGGNDSAALAVSGDGSVAVGWSTGTGISNTAAFRRTAERGIERIDQALAKLGVNTDGFALTEATGVSADGRVIVGNGIIPGNQTGGWIARLPLPGEAFVISVRAGPETGGTVTGAGTFRAGTTRTVKALPNDGFKFVNWTEGGVEVGTERRYTFVLADDRRLVARFIAK